jgi:pimeloyl-ACP methyl ester carboxylesterase
MKLPVRALLALLLPLVLVGCLADSKIADKPWNAYIEPYSQSFELDGYRMRYLDVGEGEPVFLIHGFSSSVYGWKKTIEPLREAGFRVIAIDLPGMGASEIPPPDISPTVEYMASAVLRLADHLSIDRFSVVGASMGGGLTLYLTWKTPERIKRAAVMDPASFEQDAPGMLGLLKVPGLGAAMAETAGWWSVNASISQIAVRPGTVDKTFIDEYARPMAKPGYQQFIRRLFLEFFSDEFAQMVISYNTISRPLLIFWGEQDPWIPPEFGERLQKLVPGSELVKVDQCGHMPHLEYPEIVNPRVIEFFKK